MDLLFKLVLERTFDFCEMIRELYVRACMDNIDYSMCVKTLKAQTSRPVFGKGSVSVGTTKRECL